jgi:hypothetical protein
MKPMYMTRDKGASMFNNLQIKPQPMNQDKLKEAIRKKIRENP